MRGILYWLSKEEQEMVKEFEKKYSAMVYHVIKNNTELGKLLSFLYVSDEKESWDADIEDLKNGFSFAYVRNLNEDLFSEFGGIGVKPANGGVDRTH
jgi:hypothetical protein